MSKVSFIITNSGTVNIVKDGKPFTVAVDHCNYGRIVYALKARQYDDLERLINIAYNVVLSASESTAEGNVEIKNGLIYYKGFIVDNSLTRRILEMIKKDFPFQPMVNFLENLMLNPSARAIMELYTFLEFNSLPITEDGCFLAYRRVRGDWMDFYTGTIDNRVGERPSMPRREVDDNSENTCSRGLHFCSLAYLPHYQGGQGRAIIIKINPKNVVSIPQDYDNAKGRCCEYEVIAEHNPTGVMKVDERTEAFTEPVYEATVENGVVMGKKPNGDNYWNVRGSDGRFAKKQ